MEYLEQPNNVRLRFTDVHHVDYLLTDDKIQLIVDDIDKYGKEKSKLVDLVKNEILGSINGKYAEKNSAKFSLYQDGMILPKVSFIINLKGSLDVKLLINDRHYILNSGNFLMFPSTFQYIINKKENDYFIVGHATYSNKKESLSNGANKYTVISTIMDEYSLEVFADSEEEAISKASLINISQWDHLDLYPELEDRVITKFSKWGNFRIGK